MLAVLKESERRRAELVSAAGACPLHVVCQAHTHLLTPLSPPFQPLGAAHSQQRACEAVAPAASAAVDALNADMRHVWQNQQKLETELRSLQRESQQLCTQAQSWVQMYDSFHGALKALGDVENWADVLRRDMAIVSGTIERAQRAQEEAAHDGQYTPLSITPRTPRLEDGGAGAPKVTVDVDTVRMPHPGSPVILGAAPSGAEGMGLQRDDANVSMSIGSPIGSVDRQSNGER